MMDNTINHVSWSLYFGTLVYISGTSSLACLINVHELYVKQVYSIKISSILIHDINS
jgi:hypothetical protein